MKVTHCVWKSAVSQQFFLFLPPVPLLLNNSNDILKDFWRLFEKLGVRVRKLQNNRSWKKWYVWSKIKKADNADISKSANDAYAIFMSHECKVVTRVQITNSARAVKKSCLDFLKSRMLYPCRLLIQNYTRNHVITDTNIVNNFSSNLTSTFILPPLFPWRMMHETKWRGEKAGKVRYIGLG